MKFLRNAIAEIVSLFVDDPLFAAFVILWALASWLLRTSLPQAVAGPFLFGGYAIILVLFVHRAATK